MDKAVKRIGMVVSLITIPLLIACSNSIKTVKEPKISDLVILKHKSEQSQKVQVSNDPKSWMLTNEIGYVPNGTSATILSIYDETIEAGDTKIRVLRYKIITKNDPKIVGWVWSSDAGYVPEENK